MMLKTNKRGFTLIELLVVIAIIGLLATIVLVSLNNAKNKANNTKVKADMSQLMLASEMYYSDSSPAAYPANLAALSPTYIQRIPTQPSGPAYGYAGGGASVYIITGTLVAPNAGTWTCTNGSCY